MTIKELLRLESILILRIFYNSKDEEAKGILREKVPYWIATSGCYFLSLLLPCNLLKVLISPYFDKNTGDNHTYNSNLFYYTITCLFHRSSIYVNKHQKKRMCCISCGHRCCHALNGALLYQTRLPSNTATPLALFVLYFCSYIRPKMRRYDYGYCCTIMTR